MGFGDFDFRRLFDRTNQIMDGVAAAQKLGTLNHIDRSRQYTRADAPELLRSLNEAWSQIRLLQKENAKKDLVIAQLREKLKKSQLINIALTSIITGLAWEGLKYLLHALFGL